MVCAGVNARQHLLAFVQWQLYRSVDESELHIPLLNEPVHAQQQADRPSEYIKNA